VDFYILYVKKKRGIQIFARPCFGGTLAESKGKVVQGYCSGAIFRAAAHCLPIASPFTTLILKHA